jgi:alkaline phosphatase
MFLLSLVVTDTWCQSAQSQQRADEVFFAERPKNIILMIGDGMGLTHISALTYANGNFSNLENFPVVGFQKTHSYDNLITDSAGAATAMGCGVKTFNCAIGIAPDSLPCQSILAEAEQNNMATGLVVTSAIVHATPAAFVAHQPMRSSYESIAVDFLNTDVDVLIGGGEMYFSENPLSSISLVKELRRRNYRLMRQLPTKREIEKIDKLAVFTAPEQPTSVAQGRNYLPHASEVAIRVLKNHSPAGFFLMIEGSQIDWASHWNNADMLLGELKDFDRTIGKVLDFARLDGETLVIVTADHDCGGLAINGGKKFHNLDLQFTTNGHTAAMVPVFAFGPGAETFRGIYDNTEIHTKMLDALGL